MDFALIEDIAGTETAQKLCDDAFFNNHIGNTAGDEVDGEQLGELIKGAVVLGFFPVNYPQTDGAYIFFKCRTGEVITLLIEAESQGPDVCSCDLLRISKINIE